MFGHTFYHGSIRRYVVLFGTLFNDLFINRPDETHNQIKTIKVPISYGPKEKVLARLTTDPNLDRMPAITLPRMSFEILDIKYAPERKLNTLTKRTQADTNASKMLYQYNPVPYDINFTLSIMVKNADDGTRIIEQILPFFTPDWTTTLELIPEMDIAMDIPVILNDVRLTDTYEGDFDTRRVITWDLSFTLKGYLFGPIRKNTIIKFPNVNVYSGMIDYLPGSVDIEAGNTYVVGTGTSFTRMFKQGEYITLTDGSTSNVDALMVDTVANNTFLTLTEAPSFTNATAQYYRSIDYSSMIQVRPQLGNTAVVLIAPNSDFGYTTTKIDGTLL